MGTLTGLLNMDAMSLYPFQVGDEFQESVQNPPIERPLTYPWTRDELRGHPIVMYGL